MGRATSKRRASPHRFIVGIDEVGRGCLAGPVTVAAVAIPANMKLRKLKDSKRLTVLRREGWLDHIKAHKRIFYAKANVYPKVIDRINISQAANLAATRALNRLLGYGVKGMGYRVKIFLDGGLFLNKNYNPKPYTLYARTIVKGDEKYNAIKLASIVAKVHRDRIMKRNHKKYPEYAFDEHKGYGTKVHIQTIKKYGPSELHRLTFLKNFVKIGVV